MRVFSPFIAITLLIALFPTAPVAGQVLPPVLESNLGAANIPVNGTVSYCLNVSNPNGVPLTGVSVTAPMPAGLVITSSPIGVPPASYPLCNGSWSLTSTALTVTGMTVGANASCGGCMTLTGVLAGTQTITTTPVTSNESGSGAAVSNSVLVGTPLPVAIPAIPALDPLMLALMAAMLLTAAVALLRR